MNNTEILDLNNLLAEQEDIKDIRDVTGIAKRAIAGLQVLRDRSSVRIEEVEVHEGRLSSAVRGQIADHGYLAVVAGRSNFGHYGNRQVEYAARLPIYQTVGNAPNFRGYEGCGTPFELTLNVSSRSSNEQSSFKVRHGTLSWRRQLLNAGYREHRHGRFYIRKDDEFAASVESFSFHLPEPVAQVMRNVAQRLAERTLMHFLERKL